MESKKKKHNNKKRQSSKQLKCEELTVSRSAMSVYLFSVFNLKKLVFIPSDWSALYTCCKNAKFVSFVYIDFSHLMKAEDNRSSYERILLTWSKIYIQFIPNTWWSYMFMNVSWALNFIISFYMSSGQFYKLSTLTMTWQVKTID